MARTRILVVDDHPPFRQGLAHALLADHRLLLVGQAATAEVALPLVEREVPDIILCDITLPGMDGLTLARHLQRLHPQIRVIVVALSMDEERILEAVRAGAVAFLTKDASGSAWLAALDRVMRGEYPINDRVLDSPQVARQLLAQFRGLAAAPAPQIFSPLTARELAILQLVASGQSNKGIARTLGISDQTVKNHVTAILRKLAVNDRTQAAIRALRHDGVSLDGNGHRRQ